MTMPNVGDSPRAWIGQAIAHYREGQRLKSEWQEGDRRDITIYQQSAAETQAASAAAAIAAAALAERRSIQGG